jgi:hypothetical protein
MSVRPPVRLSAWKELAFHWTNFDKIWYLNVLKNLLEEFSFHQNMTRMTGAHMKTFLHLWQYLAEFFLKWKMFKIKCIEKIKRRILCSVTFSRKSCRLWDNVEKYGWAREAANDSIHVNGVCSLFAPQLRLQERYQNMQYLLFFHGNSGYANVPQCWIICTLCLLFFLVSVSAVRRSSVVCLTFLAHHLVSSQGRHGHVMYSNISK